MKCKCDFRTFMVGDGCDVCNPSKALEYARETIDEQAALIQEMGDALKRLGDSYGQIKPPGYPLSDAEKIAKAALAKWKESK